MRRSERERQKEKQVQARTFAILSLTNDDHDHDHDDDDEGEAAAVIVTSDDDDDDEFENDIDVDDSTFHSSIDEDDLERASLPMTSPPVVMSTAAVLHLTRAPTTTNTTPPTTPTPTPTTSTSTSTSTSTTLRKTTKKKKKKAKSSTQTKKKKGKNHNSQSSTTAENNGKTAPSSSRIIPQTATVHPGAIAVRGMDAAIAEDSIPSHQQFDNLVEHDDEPCATVTAMARATSVSAVDHYPDLPTATGDLELQQPDGNHDEPKSDETGDATARIRYVALGLALLATILVVVVILVLVVFPGDDNPASNNSSSTSASASPTLMAFLEDKTRSSLVGPTAQAYEWMLSSLPLSPTLSISPDQQEEMLEKFVLATLYFANNYQDVQEWNLLDISENTAWLDALASPSSVCDWTVSKSTNDKDRCDEQGRFIRLYLRGRQEQYLTTIPSELGLLTGLRLINLDINRIQGTLPTELGALTNLEDFLVTANSLTGALPSEFGLWTNLQVLNIKVNDIQGTLPPELASWTNLVIFEAGQNKFSGNLPSPYGAAWTQINTFVVANNELTGTIPQEYGQWVDTISSLHFETNLLEGAMSDAFCDGSNINFEGELGAECASVTCDCCQFCCGPFESC